MGVWQAVAGGGLGALAGPAGLAAGALWGSQHGNDPKAPPAGPPPMPEFPGHQAGPGGISEGAGLQAFRQRALAEPGTSPWEQMATQKEQEGFTAGRDMLSQKSASQIGQGQDALAMQGGLTSGAAERLQRGGQQNLLAGLQGLGRESSGRKLDIGIEGARQQAAMQQALPGMEMGLAQFNATQAANEARRRQEYDLGRYGQMGNIWASQQLAQQMQE